MFNVPHRRVDHRASGSLLPSPYQTTLHTPMPPQHPYSDASKEAQIQLALQALKKDATLSQQRAAAIYRVPQATLSRQHAGQPSRVDSIAHSRKLDNSKEKVIVKHVLELDAQGFSVTV